MEKKIMKIVTRVIDKIGCEFYRKKLNEYLISHGRKTSMSDDELYPAFCEAAAQDAAIFEDFRRNYIYNRILEHLSKEQGKEYLDVILSNKSFANEINWNNIIENDIVGKPRKYKYIIGKQKYSIAPTTIRYAKVLQDLLCIFDVKNVDNIVEIGVGYGGQCRVLMENLNTKRYALYDLPEVLKLSKRYLSNFKIDGEVQYIDGTTEFSEQQCDLLISNYAFSELTRTVQKVYLDKLIKNAKAGYITWNALSYKELDGYSVQELLERIPGARVIDEIPLTAEGNCIIVWGTK